MPYKVLLFSAIVIAVVNAQTDCNCDGNTEDEQVLWKFLKELSKDYPDPEDRDMASVLPGVLSPLLECNCLEKNRRKRKIFPDPPEDATKDVVIGDKKMTNIFSEVMDKKEEKKDIYVNHFVKHDRHCPRDHVRVGYICVPEYLLK